MTTMLICPVHDALQNSQFACNLFHSLGGAALLSCSAREWCGLGRSRFRQIRWNI